MSFPLFFNLLIFCSFLRQFNWSFPSRLCHHPRRSTPSLLSSRARVRTMVWRVTAAITVDLQHTSCRRENWAGVTTEETVMSLSSCKALRSILSQLSPVGGRRGHLFPLKGRIWLCWWCSCKADMMLSCLPGQQNKTRVFYHHLCVDQRGYYKLTDIKGYWLDKGVISIWIMFRNI